MLNQVADVSDPSRTNQLKVLDTSEQVAEKIFQYLFKVSKGIECFPLNYKSNDDEGSEDENSKANFYRKRHIYIKRQIQERLAVGETKPNFSDIQYFISDEDGKKHIFFISSNNGHSGWKKLFIGNNREKIFNLAFKFYILSQSPSFDSLNGFEELLLVHSKNIDKKDGKLWVWGQNLFINYNPHSILTLTLSRKVRKFLAKDKYSTVDGEDVGEVLIYKNKDYYFDRDGDARGKNYISFMRFDRNDEEFEKFKQTQLYHYQNLTTKLEQFLTECGIAFEALPFQADCYVENSFITKVAPIHSLEIINNTGVDLIASDKLFLANTLSHNGVSSVSFYNDGKTIATYKQVENEESKCWEIKEVEPWSEVELDRSKNYVVFNKLLNEEASSIAYQRDDGFWNSSTKINKKAKVDFYSYLKTKFNYLNNGDFFSIQGIDIPEFKAVSLEQSKSKRSKAENKTKSDGVLFNCTVRAIDIDRLRQDTQVIADDTFSEPDELIYAYLKDEKDEAKWDKFCKNYKIKMSPEFQKIFIELAIKNWMRESLTNSSCGLPINPQSFNEQKFFAIYVRSPRKEEHQAVAVEFIYKDSCIYINNVIREINDIRKKFRFLRNRRDSEKLLDNQQYFVDEAANLYLSCYTSSRYTPTLIGRNGIIEDLENGTLKVDRQNKGEDSSKTLPLVSYYNSKVKPINRIHKMICLDLKNQEFIQYYVPPGQALRGTVKRGFRVYHLIGKTCDRDPVIVPTSKIIDHPIAALHFSTLTQNILKLSDNSQSSLLQKVAKILVVN